MGETYEDAKRLLRRRMEAARRALSQSEVADRSGTVCRRVLALPAFAAARHVVLYAAMQNEIDPVAIAAAAVAAGKRTYLPRPGHTEPGFAEIASGSILPDAAEEVLVIVPGLAFDAQGARLGRGRGWYDRALLRHPRAHRVGLAYEFQVVPRVPEASWDVRMHAVVTDSP
jgi:5-formyltetrahydrofolate cyclo-ligase